jgi:ubiquinone/menaquinone biosynthesis C-methylase UbiE
MNASDYEYRGLMADTWDIWRDDTARWEDGIFFRDIVRQYGQPALDVGCGTGRIVLDYMSDGLDIDGVDNSPEMLAICREKARKRGLLPNLYEQAMETLDLPRAYRTILVPSSSFQLVTDAEKAREVMRRFFAHLQPGGTLIMPFSFEWKEGQPLQTDWGLVFDKVRPVDGATVRRWARESFSPDQQLWHSEDRYEVLQNNVVIASEEHRRSPAGRWYSQSQAAQLYQDAGFHDIRLLQGFTDAPASPEDSLFCVLGVSFSSR